MTAPVTIGFLFPRTYRPLLKYVFLAIFRNTDAYYLPISRPPNMNIVFVEVTIRIFVSIHVIPPEIHSSGFPKREWGSFLQYVQKITDFQINFI